MVSAIEKMTETNVELCYIDERNYNENWISAKIKFIPYKCSSKSIEILPSFFYEKFTEKYNKNEAVIVFSSGTTGKSKGIILSHYAINKNADAIIKYMNLGDKDVLYIIKSFSHSSTLTGELLVALKTNIKPKIK